MLKCCISNLTSPIGDYLQHHRCINSLGMNTGENKDLLIYVNVIKKWMYHEPPYTDRYVRWCERSAAERRHLLDF